MGLQIYCNRNRKEKQTAWQDDRMKMAPDLTGFGMLANITGQLLISFTNTGSAGFVISYKVIPVLI